MAKCECEQNRCEHTKEGMSCSNKAAKKLYTTYGKFNFSLTCYNKFKKDGDKYIRYEEDIT